MDALAPHPDPEREHEDAREARDRAVAVRLPVQRRLDPRLLADRAAYEARHGTLDGPPETHRWDVAPF